MTKQPQILSIKQLFKDAGVMYRIPVYQRAYSWGKPEIEQLVKDIFAGYKTSRDKNYYLGSLVLHHKGASEESTYFIVDGQQRLTTIFLLLIYISNNKSFTELDLTLEGKLTLTFEAREKSKDTLEWLMGNKPKPKLEQSLISGYKTIENQMKEHLKNMAEETARNEIQEYILNKLKLLRIVIPEGIDVNHYFEVMNNRGEQLEKHEIIKAKLLDKLSSEKDRGCFHRIWEACSNMDKYIQMSFPKKERELFFGESYDKVNHTCFDSLSCAVNTANDVQKSGNKSNTDKIDEIKLSKFLGNEDSFKLGEAGKNSDKDDKERFESIIDFPNFLLQTLRIFIYVEAEYGISLSDIALNDNHLIEGFEKVFEDEKNKYNEKMVKKFAMTLLKCRFLFDQCIIKKEDVAENEDWSLKSYRKDKKVASYLNTFNTDNKRLLMLQAALHVSYPTRTYKYWLTSALYFLYTNYSGQKSITEESNETEFFEHLNNTAKLFLVSRLLPSESSDAQMEQGTVQSFPKDYNTILKHIVSIKKDSDNNSNIYASVELDENLANNTSYDKSPHHLIFNYLDFLLWQNDDIWENMVNARRDFRFVQRSAIEHFYPQKLENGSKILEEKLNAFGNLALINPSLNSSLSNKLPYDKAMQAKNKTNLSLKYQLMLKEAKEKKVWEEESIEKHGKEMFKLLERELKIKFSSMA